MPTDEPAALSDTSLQILLALADRPRHGYAIMVEVFERTEGRSRLWPATLYGSLKKLADAGLIEQVEDPEPNGDPRRRAYALTREGGGALDAEADRLQRIVDSVRTKRSEAGA